MEGKDVLEAPDEKSGSKKYDVFISYCRNDSADLALCIAYWFKSKGINCFIDVWALSAGEYRPEIMSAIASSKFFFVLMTKGASASKWVCDEIKKGRESHDPKNIIPVSIDEKYTESPSVVWLKGIQGFQLSRGKNFESSLSGMVADGMPEFRSRLVKADAGADQLMASIRWYKRNDGVIDKEEREKLRKQAEQFGISEERLEAIISAVEAEWDRERRFTKAVILPYITRGNRQVDPEEHDVLQKKAARFGIPQDRLNELILNAKTEQSGRRKTFAIVAIAVVSVVVVSLVWWHGKCVGDEETYDRLKSEVVTFKKEIANEREAAEQARQGAMKTKAEAEKSCRDAERKASISSLAREKAESETKAARTELGEAIAKIAVAEAARKNAESGLAKASAALKAEQDAHAKTKQLADQRYEDVAKKLDREQEALKMAESQSARKSEDLSKATEKIKKLESDNSSLKEKLDSLLRERDNGLRDI